MTKMSQFNGGKNKVRCVDCALLSGNMCTSKTIGVSPKKHRTCTLYQFKGEYKNREPIEGMYIPQIDKSTQRLIRKMVELGIIKVHEDGTPLQKQTIEMPRTTANAASLGQKGDERESLTGGPAVSVDNNLQQGSNVEAPDYNRS
jgi:hypothetical protein